MPTNIISGIDNSNQIRIEVEIKGLYKSTTIGAIMDTGFSGSLVLPLVIAVDLGLEKAGASTVTLADGSIQTLPMFLCKARIGNVTQDADVLVMGSDVLIGMDLLNRFKICFSPANGAVSVEEMPNPARYAGVVEALHRLTGR